MSSKPHYGHLSTWTAFEEIVPERRVEFVLVAEYFRVLCHGIVTDRIAERFLIDHLPVVAEIDFAM